MIRETLALHETMEIHEMLNFKTVSITKTKMMEGIVFDQELKALMERVVQQSIPEIKDLQSLLKKAGNYTPVRGENS